MTPPLVTSKLEFPHLYGGGNNIPVQGRQRGQSMEAKCPRNSTGLGQG